MKNNGVLIISICIIVAIILGVVIFKNHGKKNTKEANQEEQNQIEDGVEITENVGEDVEEDTKSNDEIFSEYYERADEMLNKMTLEEKVGQMFLARYPSNNVNSEITNNYPGGYILFAKDFQGHTKESILKKINSNQDNSKIKMFMAVDEEGGTVVRVSKHSAFRNQKFESPQELYKKGDMEAIIQDSKEKSELLKSIGINVNLAPVVDIPTDSTSFIYKRSFGKDAEETAKYSRAVIEEMNTDGMVSAMKHFPGYGDNVDTHTGIAIDDRSYEEFVNADFKPFISGIEAGAPMIMVNHNIVTCMDEVLPASLSKNVHDVLRNELGYTGLIVTDDLAMDAVEKYVKNGDAAVQAILAGNDMIISSDFVEQKAEVLKAIEKGEISEEQIDTAVRRILACKICYKII